MNRSSSSISVDASLLAHPPYDDGSRRDRSPHCNAKASPERRTEDRIRKWIKRSFGTAFLAAGVLMGSVFVLAVALLSALEFVVSSPRSRRDRKAMEMREALRRSLDELEEMTETNVGFGRSVEGRR